jgi:hypothetical protein
MALILNKEFLSVLFSDKEHGLLKFIRENKPKKKIENLKHLRNGILCLSHVLKTHNTEISGWVREITGILI